MAERNDDQQTAYDVVVIGAGPGGSATATMLAKAGRSVLVLERREFPRFHIGESLVPYANAALEKLGVLDRVAAQGYVDKLGAEFSRSGTERYGRVPFEAQGPGRHAATFQMERAHFDQVLAEHAQECGATVVHQASVTELLVEDGTVTGVQYQHQGAVHTVRARYVVDAGGRASKIAQTFGLRRPIDRMRMVAVYRHLKGLDERFNPGAEGDIQLGGHKDGWLWAIPIWPDTISVGAVMPRSVLRDGDAERLFNEHVSRVGRISRRLEGTVPVGELRVETDYCYYSDTVAGPGWFMVGDAACFFDPIFSGGVFLALTSGIEAAETINRALAEPDRTEALQQRYSAFYKTGYDVYARIIQAYYDYGYNLRPYLAEIGMDAAGHDFAGNRWLVRLLCGDFWNDRNPLNQRLRKETRWDVFAPFEPVSGCPFYADLDAAEAAEAASAR